MTPPLVVNEIFGPTWQGEGVAAGQHCLFLRLAPCNLECTWCDTPYTWAYTEEKAAIHMDGELFDRNKEEHLMHVGEVMSQLEELWPLSEQPTMIVITGGEPLMQQEGLLPLLQYLHELKCDIQFETAGTIKPRPEINNYVSQYNVSPKLGNSGNPLKKRRKDEVLRSFASNPRAFFKFVVTTAPEDLEEVDEIVNHFDITIDRVQVMPEGIDTGTILDTAFSISKEVLKRGYGLSLRNHILIWGDKRGV